MISADYFAVFFGATTTILGYYILKNHSRHFAETCLDSYLIFKNRSQDLLISPTKIMKPKITLLAIHTINLETLKITHHPSLQLPKTIPSQHLLHLKYRYQDQDQDQSYRLVLNHNQNYLPDLLESPDWIINGVSVGIDEIDPEPKSEEEQDLFKEYAGPLEDFYESINLVPDSRGLLNKDMTDFLLISDHPLTTRTVTISTELGEEYIFTSPNTKV